MTYTTLYRGEDEVAKAIQFDSLNVDATGAMACAVIDALSKLLLSQTTADLDPIRTAVRTAREEIDKDAPLWESATVSALDTLNDAVMNWVNADALRNDAAIDEREQLSAIIAQAKQGNLVDKARTWVEDQLPTFIYFDDYGQLETRIHLPTYIERGANPDPRTRTQTALFEWSGIDVEEILNLGRPRDGGETDEEVHRRHEKRRALLDSASFTLTGDWIRWWTEKRHRLHFDVDGQDLVLRVSDEHNEFPVPFEERSRGFQWFFSFYLVFLVESGKAHKGAILLLDEPGLHLHPTLQVKLIDLFERISGDNQLLYSTHLPFLVDGDHLERVRTVHLAGPEPQKTVIFNDIRPTGDRGTLFPIQAALGYSIAQTLFLGKRSLIVEGITDYWLIRTLNNCLSAVDVGAGLHEDTILVPAGGTSRLMPLASIMIASTGVGEGHLMVLLDTDKEGWQAASRIDDVFGGESSVIMLGPTLELAEATIEDLVPRDVYVAAVNQAGQEIALNDRERAAATNVKAMDLAFQRKGRGRFGMADKAAAALVLIGAWGKDPTGVPESTWEKACVLIDAINRRFEKRLSEKDVDK